MLAGLVLLLFVLLASPATTLLSKKSFPLKPITEYVVSGGINNYFWVLGVLWIYVLAGGAFQVNSGQCFGAAMAGIYIILGAESKDTDSHRIVYFQVLPLVVGSAFIPIIGLSLPSLLTFVAAAGYVVLYLNTYRAGAPFEQLVLELKLLPNAEEKVAPRPTPSSTPSSAKFAERPVGERQPLIPTKLQDSSMLSQPLIEKTTTCAEEKDESNSQKNATCGAVVVEKTTNEETT